MASDQPLSDEPASTGGVVAPARGNGRAARTPTPAPRGRRPPGPSTKPALVVLGIILALFLLGLVLETVSGTQSRPTPTPTSIATAGGAGLQAVPARPLLGAIVTPGEPPDDLLDALAVPAGSSAVAGSSIDRSVELYDHSLRFALDATDAKVITFFRAELRALHWKRLSDGPTSGGDYQILEQHPASDGHEWELGVTVAPTVFASPSSGGAGSVPPTGTTAFTFRLFAVSDQN
jgi:hypothetical protein